MKVNANTIRPGNILDYEGKLWSVTKIHILQPGKGGAFIQIEMRDIESGNKTNTRFRTQETVEKVRVDSEEFQFLFAEGEQYTFMNNQTFDQIILEKDLIGYPSVFLQDGMKVSILLHEGKALGVELPASAKFEIVEADPVIKGQTVSSSYKPAKLENGEKILVPPHIEAGTRVVVSTSDGSYVEKAKD